MAVPLDHSQFKVGAVAAGVVAAPADLALTSTSQRVLVGSGQRAHQQGQEVALGFTQAVLDLRVDLLGAMEGIYPL
jgi:pyridoxal biosynthesis lyase PdxS